MRGRRTRESVWRLLLLCRAARWSRKSAVAGRSLSPPICNGRWTLEHGQTVPSGRAVEYCAARKDLLKVLRGLRDGDPPAEAEGRELNLGLVVEAGSTFRIILC